jgi:hypothetical protein
MDHREEPDPGVDPSRGPVPEWTAGLLHERCNPRPRADAANSGRFLSFVCLDLVIMNDQRCVPTFQK